jgi:hypothetical protein
MARTSRDTPLDPIIAIVATPGVWALYATGDRDVTENPLNGEPSPPAGRRAASIQRGLREPRTPGDPPDDGGYMCGPGAQGTAADFLFIGQPGAGTDGTQYQLPKQKLRSPGGIPNPVPPPGPDSSGDGQ